MNIIEIFGHLGADPEVRVTPNGTKVTTLRVACNSKKSGKEETMWWRVTLWGTQFDKMMTYLKKGSAVIVVGEMTKPEIYNDKEGRPQVSLQMTAEMIRFSPFGTGRGERSESGSTQQYQAKESGGNEFASYGATTQNDDEEMPF